MASILEILLRARGSEQVKGELGKTNKAAKESSKVFSALGSILSVGILAKGISSSIKAYGVQELAVTKLNSALKAQNVFTTQLSKALQEEASALQSATIFGDEAILSAQAFGMSMGMNVDTVRKITPVILDFASAMGIDLQTAFRVVGQAAAGDTGMLKRYGIIVDEAALKSDGFNAVLATMQKNFRGTAEEVAKSGIGPMEQFKNTMGDVMEIIGETIIPALNNMIRTYRIMEETISGHNKKMEESADVHKRVTQLLRDENTEEQTRVQILRAIRDGNDEMLEVIVKRSEAEQGAHEIRVEQSEAWKKRLEKEAEKEAEREKKLLEAKVKAREEAAKEINGIQDSITANLESNIVDMILAEKTFGEGVEGIWKGIGRTVLEILVKQVIEEKAAAGIRMGVEAAVAGAKSISAYAGVPVVGIVLGLAAAAAAKGEIDKMRKFHGGGIVPGLPGEEKVVIAKAGEKFTPPGMPAPISGARNVFNFYIQGTYLEADETKWSRIFREKVYPEMQRYLRKTGESFSGS